MCRTVLKKIFLILALTSIVTIFSSHKTISRHFHRQNVQNKNSSKVGRNRGHIHIPELANFVIDMPDPDDRLKDGKERHENFLNQTPHQKGPDSDFFSPGESVAQPGKEIGNASQITNKYGRQWLLSEKTPALVGASAAKITCDVDLNNLQLAYWNDPQGIRDQNFVSPFRSEEKNGKTKYLTFESDHGGWNNVRMALEIIFVIAVATGRTLVLPPDQPLYLLRADKKKIQRGFADFYPFDSPSLQKLVPIITTEEFLLREGGDDGQFPIPTDKRQQILNAQNYCQNREKSDIACHPLWYYLRDVGLDAKIDGGSCFIFDSPAENAENGEAMKAQIDKICKLKGRRTQYYNKEIQDAQLLHFSVKRKGGRLLNHFYALTFFTDPVIDNYFKRFVRDHLHYNDSVFCAAGKIIKALQEEGRNLGFSPDKFGAGGYSSMHVRRGDLQFKEVKIPAEEWLENTQDLWGKNEVLYIATDEKDQTFFDPIKKHYTVKFLNDYWDVGGLSNVDPNHFGMIDTIIASRGRMFAGTYQSTFTGFITRMRGYHGMLASASWYGMKRQKSILQKWVDPQNSFFSREFPVGWVGIDGDELVTDYPHFSN